MFVLLEGFLVFTRVMILVTSHPTDLNLSDCFNSGFGGVSPGKVWRVHGDLRGCRGLWGVSGENKPGGQSINRCAGTVSKVSFFWSYNKYVNMFKCNDDLCLCQPVLRYVEAVETMKNPWVSWLLFICTWGPTTAHQFNKSIPSSQGLACAGRWSSCCGGFFQGLTQGSKGNVEPDYESICMHITDVYCYVYIHTRTSEN